MTAAFNHLFSPQRRGAITLPLSSSQAAAAPRLHPSRDVKTLFCRSPRAPTSARKTPEKGAGANADRNREAS